ncbi:portal protein [Gordonia phage Tardus]|uniref:Portal protein n=1 Tax=Gordonia phage Tardus TaxID=2939734 RepID=A0A9E7J732_9CAUD|nr:portal protein [Gordonia phage Tardus]
MPRRSDSTAHRIANRSRRAEQTPESMIAAARRLAPSATSIAVFDIEPTKPDTKGRRRRSQRGDSITAAAEVINGAEQKNGRAAPRRRKRQAERWQSEVWELRNESPEMRFLGDRKARAASQCRIYIGHHTAGETAAPKRVTEGIVGQLAQQMFGSLAEVEQKLKRYVQHIEYNGESIINARNDPDQPDRVVWSVHSSRELLGSQAGQYQLTDGVTPRKVDDDNEIISRSWVPSPELSALADAPVRALLPVLRELVQMTKYVGAQIDSRLASGGGLLIVDSRVSIHDAQGKLTSLAKQLQDYMLTAVEDRGSAESIAPLVAQITLSEGQTLEQVAKLITFGEVLDPHMHERRQEAIKRIALGMDNDPAALEGAGSMNHWSAWSLDESEIKLGVSPILSTFCHTMTETVVRPLLRAAGVKNADEFSVWFDTTELKLRPDRSKDAQWAYSEGIMSAARVLEESGFDPETDMPDDAERARRVLMTNLIPLLGQLGSASPGAIVEILRAIGVDIPATTMPDTEQATPPAAPPPPKQLTADDPANSPPDTLDNPPPADGGPTL